MTDGVLPLLDHAETGLWPATLYPLRSAEAMTFTVVMACILWGLMLLLPEYCLGLWADANMLGTPSMGMLIILISVIPGLLVLPLVLIYFLQYLGRVLVTSARGDTAPPRTPDRNFEGFTAGLGPWLEWLVLGLGVSALPAGLYLMVEEPTLPSRGLLVLALIVFAMPYASISLMLAFLHDRALAATPVNVIGTLLRHGISFAPTLARVALVTGGATAVVVLVFSLRARFFWIYLIAALPACVSVVWAALVIARVLGLHYFHHQESLRWNHRGARWGVRWRI